MAESYGRFAKGLAISTGLFAAFLAATLIISHPLGIALAALVLLVWGFFLKIVAFIFEPQHLQTYRGEPEIEFKSYPDSYAHLNPEEAKPGEYPDVSRLVEIATRAREPQEEPEEVSRILGPQHKETLWSRCEQEDLSRIKKDEPKYGFE